MLFQSPLRCTRNLIETLSGRGRRSRAESARVEALRELCHDLIRDLGPGQQLALGLRIGQARAVADFWHLRAYLFGAISIEHGERVARERLQRFDSDRH